MFAVLAGQANYFTPARFLRSGVKAQVLLESSSSKPRSVRISLPEAELDITGMLP